MPVLPASATLPGGVPGCEDIQVVRVDIFRAFDGRFDIAAVGQDPHRETSVGGHAVAQYGEPINDERNYGKFDSDLQRSYMPASFRSLEVEIHNANDKHRAQGKAQGGQKTESSHRPVHGE